MVIRKNCFGDALYWYQKKISAYDQQQWEKKLEERMLKDIHFDVARKVAKLKTELIDLDLIRGSAFNKAKPKQSWLTSTYFGIVRVCLFPFYLRCWIEQSNRAVSIGLLILWALQVSAMFVYFSCDQLNNSDKFQTIPLSELISPLVMFFILGSIHSQISAGSLISLKNKHLSKVTSTASTNLSNLSNLSNLANLASVRLVTKKKHLLVNATASVDGQTDQTAHADAAQVSKAIPSRDSGLKAKPSSTAEGRKKFDTLRKNVPKTYANKSSACSGLRKRKKGMFHANRTMNCSHGNVSNDLMATDADKGSCGNLSLCSTFHGRLNERFDQFLITGNGNDLLDEEDMPTNQSIKSMGSSTSASLSNYSTDVQHELMGKRCKQVQCELSSSESDRGMPPSPIKLINDWPMINTDCSSDEDDDDDDDEEEDEVEVEVEEEEQEEEDDEQEPNQHERCSGDRSDGGQQQVSTGRTKLGDAHQTNAMHQVNNTSVCGSRSRTRSMTRSRTMDIEFKSNVRGRQMQLNACLIADSSELEFNKNAMSKDDPTMISNVGKSDGTDTISCSLYKNNEWCKMDLSVLDISSIVIRKVASQTHSNEYFYLGICCSLLLAIMPQIFRLQQNCPVLQSLNNVSLPVSGVSVHASNETSAPVVGNHYQPLMLNSVPSCGSISASNSTKELIEFLHLLPVILLDLVLSIFSNPTYTWQMQYVVIVACLQRFCLSLLFFFFLCVAERTFRERLLYAKHFSHMTSARRAKKAELPHFRLNKVRNIKCWLSVRSYLKRHGPQRSVNCIVSTSFILAVTILTFLCIQLLKEAEICTGKLYCYEMVFWNMAIGVYIMRLIILGSKINRKYRSNLSVLLTEQINLYLKLEQKPHKKEELTLANNVIKLACDLIKELEVPFKISGFSANPYLYNITKVIVLSAFSSLLSEILGFKLKLTKIKLSG